MSNVPAGLPKAGPRGGRTLLVVVLLAAIYAGYARALDGELQFDDLRGIEQNELVKNPRLFLEPGMLMRIHALDDLTLALNYRVNGMAVRPYHLVNLALHLGAVVVALALALLLLRRIDWPAPFATAWLAAALFGLHPMQTEAVSYIYQRAEVLASLFYLLGLLLALTAEEKGPAFRRGAAAAGALIAFALAWSAKPVAVTFPALLVLCTLAFPPPDSGSAIRRAARTLPLWVMAAVFATQLLTGPLRGNPEGGFDVPTMSPLRYFLTQPRVVLTYLRLFLWPAGQNVDWDFAPSESLLEPSTALAFAAVAALVLLAVWLWRRGDGGGQPAARMVAFGIFWFFIVLAPTSSFVPLPDVIAEHRTYLANFGLSFAAAAEAVHLAHRFGRRGLFAASAVALAACVALGVALERRNAVWESGANGPGPRTRRTAGGGTPRRRGRSWRPPRRAGAEHRRGAARAAPVSRGDSQVGEARGPSPERAGADEPRHRLAPDGRAGEGLGACVASRRRLAALCARAPHPGSGGTAAA